MLKIFGIDFIFSFVFSFLFYLLLNKVCFINNTKAYIFSGIIFLFIFVGFFFLSYYIYKIKKKIEELNQKIDKMSKIDEITGIYNRDFLLENLKKYIEVSKRKNLPLSIMIIEIENFKEINEEFGFERANEILKKVSNVLKNNVRGMDLVGRYSINEFLIASFSTKDEILKFANRLHPILREIKIDGINLRINIGVIERKNLNSINEILKQAEEAIFLAHKKGGNRIDFLEHFLLLD